MCVCMIRGHGWLSKLDPYAQLPTHTRIHGYMHADGCNVSCATITYDRYTTRCVYWSPVHLTTHLNIRTVKKIIFTFFKPYMVHTYLYYIGCTHIYTLYVAPLAIPKPGLWLYPIGCSPTPYRVQP